MHKPTNRDKKRASKLKGGYCGCDKTIITRGQKCPECGCLMGRKNNKKDHLVRGTDYDNHNAF